jgi:preprotein translocase subunit SecD
MNLDLRWRILLILGLTALCVVAIYPPSEKIHLGLDLKGGIHMVMRVKTDDAVKAEIDVTQERIRSALGEKGLAPAKISADGLDAILLEGVDAARLGEIRDILTTQFGARYAISSPSPDRLRLLLKPNEETQTRDMAVRQALETIRTRVDKFGVAEPTIQRQGSGAAADRILIQLPGVENPERVKDLIGSPAFLEWKLVKVPPGVVAGDFRAADNPETIIRMFGAKLPDDVEILPQEVTGADGQTRQYSWPVTKSSPITGNDLKNSRRSQNRFGEAAVEFTLSADAGRRFQELTRKYQGQLLAIVLDRKIISAPRINAVIAEQGIIEGNFTLESAEDLALKLRSGALPAGMEILEERTVGPSLGADSVRQGVVASVIGSIIIVLFMLVYYRGAGINASVALVLNLLILLAAMAYFHSTLTLPGIAGFALTVGMAVDANVLVFERIREELRRGRAVRAAIHAGFDRAFPTIIDSHCTVILAGFFLYAYGTGAVKGFAVTLNVGIAANLFTALVVSRAIFDSELTINPRKETLSI